MLSEQHGTVSTSWWYWGPGRAGRGEEVTCDLPGGADDHGLIRRRSKRAAVAGAAALLRGRARVLLPQRCRGAAAQVPLQQLGAGQDDSIISESYAKPVGMNGDIDREGEEMLGH